MRLKNWGSALHRPLRPVKGSPFHFLSLLMACCFFILWTPKIGFSAPAEVRDPFIEYLGQEQSNLAAAFQEATRVVHPSAGGSDLVLLKKGNKDRLTLIHATIASLDGFLINQRKLQQNLNLSIKKIEQMPLDQWEAGVTKEHLAHMNQQNLRNNQIIDLILENLALARRYQNALLVLSRQLEVWQAKMDEQQRLDDLQARIKVLEQARDALYLKNVALQQKNPTHTPIQEDVKTLLNNQSILLIQYRITELELQKKLLKADYSFIRNQDLKTIQAVSDTYKSAINQLLLIEESLKQMMSLLKGELLLAGDVHLKQQLRSIQQTATLRLSQIASQLKALNLEFEKKKVQLKQQLSVRQGFTEYHVGGWSSIADQFGLIPSKGTHYLKSLALKFLENHRSETIWTDLFYWVCLAVMLFIMVGFRILFRGVSLDKERSRLSGHLYSGFLILFYRNLPQLTLLSAMVLTFFIYHVPHPHYELLLSLMGVWLVFRSLVMVARMLLLESTRESTGLDTRLYYRLRALLLMGGWVTALMVLSHQLPLTLLLQDIFNRLFMLFLLAIACVMILSKDVIRYLLRPFLKTKKRYFRNAVSLSSVLIPLILLTTALIGLVGYIHLAWTLSRYQAYLLLLMTGYVLVSGLMFDALELLSEGMISSMRNGWLWIEVFLKPLDKILRALLFLFIVYLVFQLFGWYSDSFVMGLLETIGHYPLVDVSGVHITCLSLFKFGLLVCLLIWMSKWTREFCYRWLYRHASDAGIRNSFSVFTQYAVIVIGSIITLRVLGLDFSGMSMVIGGLAVGMGFGLRDFASNIVGGIMLLIERPVREGDLITLGEYEGRVAHIGIRSMRVSSWDNMEVLIPNAETFNKPFTNWTHQDSVVRTVVPIKVSREDDPLFVQQLILGVIASIPEILREPGVQVYLKQIDEALVEFELRYYINVQTHTRFEIRSKVLFALMEQFKVAGVKPPIPPFHVEIQGNAAAEAPK